MGLEGPIKSDGNITEVDIFPEKNSTSINAIQS